MKSIKTIRDLLPTALSWEVQTTKRRKATKPWDFDIMEMDGSGQFQHQRNGNAHGLFPATPSFFVSRGLADNGLPDRLDPLSIDYLTDFDIDDGSNQYETPADIVMAIQYGDADELIRLHKSRDRLVAQRNSQGETLLHVACRLGSLSIIKTLLHEFKMPALVLDKQGRSPLHCLCLAMNTSITNYAAKPQNCDHVESMRLLLREKPTLILYKDKPGKVPLEYIYRVNDARNSNMLLLWKTVNEMLTMERIVSRVADEMSRRVEKFPSGQRVTAWEKIERMIDLSGMDSALMETGFSF